MISWLFEENLGVMTIEEPSVHEPLVEAAGADGFVAKSEFPTQVRSAIGRMFATRELGDPTP